MERRRLGQEVLKAKREKEEMELRRIAEDKRKEKLADELAKQRIKERIQQDRLASTFVTIFKLDKRTSTNESKNWKQKQRGKAEEICQGERGDGQRKEGSERTTRADQAARDASRSGTIQVRRIADEKLDYESM